MPMKREATLIVRVTKDARAAVEAKAEVHDVTVSEVLRKMFSYALSNMKESDYDRPARPVSPGGTEAGSGRRTAQDAVRAADPGSGGPVRIVPGEPRTFKFGVKYSELQDTQIDPEGEWEPS